MAMDTAGNFWFIDGATLKCTCRKTNAIKIYNNEKYGDSNTICRTKNGTLWMATTSGSLKKYNAATDSFYDFDMFSHSPKTSQRWIEKIYATTDNNILVGTLNHGFKIFNLKDSSYTDIIARNTDSTEIFVRDFLQSRPGEYWIATESGIFIYNN